MSQNVPDMDTELLQRLLAKLEESSARADYGDNDDIKRKLDKLDRSLDAQAEEAVRTQMTISKLKEDIIAENERLNKLQEDLDKEVEKANAKIDNVMGSRSQYVQQGLMLVAGALIPAVFNLLVK